MHVDPTKAMRSPADPPTLVEKAVFGPDVRLHEIPRMPLEQGSGALPADRQASLHFQTLCQQLSDICSRHRAEGDPAKKAKLRQLHEDNVGNVVAVGEKLIEAKIIAKTSLSLIPQL